MPDFRDAQTGPRQNERRLPSWLLVSLPVAACLAGAAVGLTWWLPVVAGAFAAAAGYAIRSRRALPASDDLPADLDCETEFACRELLQQCDRLAQSPAVRDDPDAPFYLEHIARLRGIVIELARDRAALKRLMHTLDEPALQLSTERLGALAEGSTDPEVAELYRSAHRVRDQQLALLENLKEVRAAGDAHWEHLAAVIGELATSTALRGMRSRIQAQQQLLHRLTAEVAEYRAVVDELRVSLGDEVRS